MYEGSGSFVLCGSLCMKEWIICVVWIIMYEGRNGSFVLCGSLCMKDGSFVLCGSLCMKEWIICVVWIIMYEGVDHLGCVDHYV